MIVIERRPCRGGRSSEAWEQALALAAARRDGPRDDGPAATSTTRTRRLGFVYMPMGCDLTGGLPPERIRSTSSRRPSSLAAVTNHVTAIANLELRTPTPARTPPPTPRFLSAARRS